MAITAGEPRPQLNPTGNPDPTLRVHADAPQPQVVADTHTPQAQADAASIDRAFDGK